MSRADDGAAFVTADHAADAPAPVKDELAVPTSPLVRGVLRDALSSFYFNSLAVLPANIMWGVLLLVTLGILFAAPLIALLIFLFVLPFPTAGMFRLAAFIVRGQPASIRDALAWRSFGVRALGTGVVVGASSIVLGFNLVVGLSSGDLVGVAFATAAFWGLVIVWFVAAAVWPLLFDPLRVNEPVALLVRLAATVALVHPLRYLVLMIVLGVFLVVSTVLAAALLTVSAAYFALVMAFYALHTADRIEHRATIVVTR